MLLALGVLRDLVVERISVLVLAPMLVVNDAEWPSGVKVMV